MTARTTASMWECRARPGSGDTLVDWVYDIAIPSVRAWPGLERVEVLRSSDERVLVISWWSTDPVGLPEPPGDLLARPPQVWEFEQINRVTTHEAPEPA